MFPKKNVNGVEITEGPIGGIVTLDEKNIPACIEILKESPIRMMKIIESRIGKPSYNLDNLDVLKKFDFGINLIIVTSNNIKNWDGLYFLEWLNELRCEWLEGVNVDFLKIKGLKVLWVDWNKNQSTLFNLNKLEELRLWKYKPKIETLQEFKNLKSLKSLEVVQSSIKSIKGIEELESLKSFSVCYNKNLEILEKSFSSPLSNVETLHIEVCKKINLDFIKLFPNLKKLEIVNNGTIYSLRPILDGLPKLTDLFIGETLIEESGNEYYKEYKNIKNFFFDERKHHKLKLKELKSP